MRTRNTMLLFKKGVLLFLVFFILFFTSSCGIPNWFTFFDGDSIIEEFNGDYIEFDPNALIYIEGGPDGGIASSNCTVSVGFLYAFYDGALSSRNSFVSSMFGRITSVIGSNSVNRNYIPRPGDVLATYTTTVDDESREYRMLSLRDPSDRNLNGPRTYVFSTSDGFEVSGLSYYFDVAANNLNSVTIELQDRNRTPITSVDLYRANNKTFATGSNLSNRDVDVSQTLDTSRSNLELIIVPFVYVTLSYNGFDYPNKYCYWPSLSSSTGYITIPITLFSGS